MEYRQAMRTCHCRGCDKEIKPKTEKIIYMYSHRNRGQNIILCEDCVREMNSKFIFDTGEDE